MFCLVPDAALTAQLRDLEVRRPDGTLIGTANPTISRLIEQARTLFRAA